MNPDELKAFVAAKLNTGASLGQVQKALAENGVNMTYLDLRLLAAELEVNWKKQDPKAVPKPVGDAAKVLDKAELPAAGTQVTVHKIVRPGAAMSGEVVFSSGAKGDWYIDNYGRPGLSLATGSSKPTEEDLQEFGVELQRKLGGGR